MKITLAGRTYEITREDFEAVADEEPSRIQRYAIVIGGRQYPLKQTAARALGVPPVAFTSQQAYRWAVNLGFDVADLGR